MILGSSIGIGEENMVSIPQLIICRSGLLMYYTGELVYLHDENILILNRSRDAMELLEKRSRIYSDRRISAMAEL